MRTNKYRYLNVFQVYEGEEFTENRMTGIHKLSGTRVSSKVIGWGMAFELFGGFSKTHYMSCEEIAAHAERYSQSYKYPNSPWNDPVERPKMEKKTVLSAGLRIFGVFDEHDLGVLDEIEENSEWHDVTDLPDEDAVSDPVEPAKPTINRLEAMGYPPDPEPEKTPEQPYELKNQMTADEKLDVMTSTLGVAKKQIADSLELTKIVTLDIDITLLLSWFGFYRSHRSGKDKMEPINAAGLANSEFQAWQGQQAQASFIPGEVVQP
jgi:recombinational DNA repair protein RecT